MADKDFTCQFSDDFLFNSTDSDLYEFKENAMTCTKSGRLGYEPIPELEKLKMELKSYKTVKSRDCEISGTIKTSKKHQAKIALAEKLIEKVEEWQSYLDQDESERDAAKQPEKLNLSSMEKGLKGRIGKLLKQVKAFEEKQMQQESNPAQNQGP